MSKSYGNYIGLTDEPDDMFGKVMSIPDELMIKYFRLCTPLAVDEVDAHRGRARRRERASERRRSAASAERSSRSTTAPDAAEAAEEAFDRVFKQHQVPEDVPEVAVDLRRRGLPARRCCTSSAWSRRRARAGA